jgi:hypothetical protein
MKNKIYTLSSEDHFYLDSEWNVKFRDKVINFLKDENLVSNDFNNLENIHNHILDKSLIDYDFNSGVNGITKHLYSIEEKLIDIYYSFLKDLYNKVGFDFYFQETPTVRVHCPNAANQHHYPRYHSDCFYGHPTQEINIWFSLTENSNSGFYVIPYKDSKEWLEEHNNNSEIFIQNAINNPEFNKKGDSLAYEVDSALNKVFLFDSLCIHTNQPRIKDARVSIDIRINPVEDFVDGFIGKGRMKAEFKPGGRFGYHEKSIKELL